MSKRSVSIWTAFAGVKEQWLKSPSVGYLMARRNRVVSWTVVIPKEKEMSNKMFPIMGMALSAVMILLGVSLALIEDDWSSLLLAFIISFSGGFIFMSYYMEWKRS